jgi:hypothetical protein
MWQAGEGVVENYRQLRTALPTERVPRRGLVTALLGFHLHVGISSKFIRQLGI